MNWVFRYGFFIKGMTIKTINLKVHGCGECMYGGEMKTKCRLLNIQFPGCIFNHFDLRYTLLV